MSSRTVGLLVALVVGTGGLVAADLVVPFGTSASPAVREAGPVVAGGWYCAAVGTEGDDVARLSHAAPRSDLEPPSQVLEADLLGGSRAVAPSVNVFPEQAAARELGDGVAAAEARWFAHPMVTSRIWTVRPESGPRGVVSGACATAPDDDWLLPGLSTAGGASATVHVLNPFAEAASVGIVFLTPEGEVDPVRLRNQVVPANGTLVLDVNEFLPRQGDLAVEVRARSGRVVVEGVQRVDAAIGGVNGISLVRAATAARSTWTVPWALLGAVAGPAVPPPPPPAPAPTDTATTEPAADPTPDATPTSTASEDAAPDAADPEELPVVSGGPLASDVDTPATSWVWVANPNDEPAAITVTMHGPDGPLVPELGEELSVAARGVLRVSLDGLLPDGVSAAGVTVTSVNDLPVAASVGTVVRRAGDDANRTGYSVQQGAAAADVQWIVSGPVAPDGALAVHLTNPSAESAVVDVAIWDGAAVQRPPGLQSVTVAPGAFVEVALDAALVQATSYTAFVTATSGSIVVGSRSVSAGVPIDWAVTTGVPAAVWRGGGTIPPVVQRPDLVEPS